MSSGATSTPGGSPAMDGGAGPARCQPNEPACDGSRATRCDAQGTGYLGGGVECSAPQTCMDGTCVEPRPCVPQSRFCVGADVRVCAADGLSSELLQSCAGGRACVNGSCESSGRSGPPSCLDLPATCGPSSDEDCCSSPLVPGGTFNRDNNPAYPATLSRFRLDKFEVTVGRFRKFVDAVVGGWRPAAGAGKHVHLNGGQGLTNASAGYEPGWDIAWNKHLPSAKATWDGSDYLTFTPMHTWSPSSGPNEQRPINCVNWYQAAAFCIWDGGFLPSEAEWNYAAAGGSEQRQYPWSSPPGSTSIDCSYATYSGCEPSGIEEVGSKAPMGNGRYGQADLAANVIEWMLDWAGGYPASCLDCANTAPSSDRKIRGGTFSFPAVFLLTSDRSGVDSPETKGTSLGVRCARAP